MKEGLLRSAFAGASLVLVCLVAWVDVDRTSPGPIGPTHARIGKLAGPDGCSKCHGGIFQSMHAACFGCHEGIREDAAASAGLHGNLPEGTAVEGCARCHGEHGGEAIALSGRAAFARAGIPDPGAFDHAVLDFRLAGRHAELGCADCHEHAEALLLEEGTPRFRGLDQDCASCHEDVHEGAMARACADCHGQARPFAEVVAFRHVQGFDGRGAHARVACSRCHQAGGEHAVEVLAGAGPFPPDRACADCHESPHEPAFVQRSAAASLAPDQACSRCHDALHEDWRARAMDAEAHAATGFPLEVPHAGVECAACHAGAPEASWEERFPGRAADECAACHEDPHGGQFDHAPFLGRGCLACHGREGFRPFTFDVARHDETAFALEHAHRAVACASCHAKLDAPAPRERRIAALAVDAVRRFRGTPQRCAECHADAHRGRLRAAAEGEGCAECHTSALFADVERAAFAHGERTAFALDGAHASLACEDCHRPSPRADERHRRFGFAHELFGEPFDACATCHADPHRGVLLAAAGEDPAAAGCERCHTTADFSAVDRQGFDHARWTGYPLAREHARLDCESCHAPPAPPDADARHFGFALGRGCEDCHGDPHVGQFEPLEKRCSDCHADDLRLVFDHQRDSRFPLDETHRKLDCAACHLSWPLLEGGSAVRYRPLGTTCEDCHGPGGGRR